MNIISSRQVMRIEKISIRGLLVDPILNSLNLHQKNCIPGSKEICSLQKRSWKLKRLRNQSEVLVFIFDLELIHVYRISLKDFHWHLPITDTVRASGRNVSAKSERSFAIACRKKLNSIKNFPSWSFIIKIMMVIENSGVQFGLNTYAWF